MSTPTSDPLEAFDVTSLDEAGFQRLYATRIEPLYLANEGARQDGVRTFRRRLLIGAPLALLVSVGAWLLFKDIFATLIVTFIAAVLVASIAYMKLAGVAERVKEESLKAIAEALSVRFTMKDFEPPALRRCLELNLLPSFDRSRFEDLFQGRHRGASFDLYEAILEDERRDKDGDRSYVTVFRGQLIRLAFPRRFLGRTVVRRDAGIFNFLNSGGKGLERVGLEDPRFEKTFEVFGDDQVEARFLVHPVLMERLLDLEAAFEGKKLRCAFEGGDLLIAIEGGNLFEAGDMFKTLADPARARRLVDEIAKVFAVMDAVLTAQPDRRIAS